MAFPWLINGDDPNYLQVLRSSSKFLAMVQEIPDGRTASRMVTKGDILAGAPTF